MSTPATKLKQQAILRQLRRDIGCSRFYSPEFVRGRCEIAYGRAINDRQWNRWKVAVRAGDDSALPLGGMFSEATYILLLTRAALLRGNRKGGTEKKQIPVERLNEAVRAIISGDRPWDVPVVISYENLKRLIELRSLKTYTERHLRSQGLKRSQKLYSKAQAVQILSNFPDYSYVFKTHENQSQQTAGTLTGTAA